MARRRRRYGRRKTPNTWFIIFQIVVLVALLIALLEVRDSVSQGTSAVVESLAGDDIDVQRPVDGEDHGLSGRRTDDNTERGPAKAPE